MNFEFEESYIGTQKAYFESIFKKDADEYLNEFLMYLNERTNRRLTGELEDFNKSFKDLKELGILDNLND